MAAPSDQQLIQFIQQGRREGLAQLFDRYSADLYDFLARLIGDRDQAARLLEEVFMRVPGAVAGLPARESVRGWLYSLGRESGLTQLRQRGWLDALPPTEEPGPAGLAGDIWRAARAMPAFYRAVLVVQELHALSPTEKARALGVQRTDLPRLVDEARRAFTRQFDALARAEGRPLSSQIDTDRIIGLRQRVGAEDASLFSYLPVLVLPDSLEAILRQRVLQAMTGQPLRPIETPPVTEPPPPPPPPATVIQQELPPEPPPTTAITRTTTTTTRSRSWFSGDNTPTLAIAALAGISLAIIICGLVYLLLPKDKPVISAVFPPEGGSIALSDLVTVGVTINDSRAIDALRSKVSVDGKDVSSLSRATQNTISWSGPLSLGTHTAAVTVFDAGGQQTNKTWAFSVVPGTPTQTPTAPVTVIVATVTPLPTLTGLPTLTPLPLPPTATRVPLPTITPLPPTNTAIPPTLTPIPPTATPCLVGILGKAFNDLNANQMLDPGEPTLSGVTLYLQNAAGQNLAVSVSDAFGAYQFVNLPFGTYRVAAATPANWYATTPTIVTVNMFGCGAFVGLDFGFTQSTPTPISTNTPTITPIVIVITPTATNTPPPTATPTQTSVPPTSTPTPTPTSTATPNTPVPGIITNITLSVSGPTYSGAPGKCPASFTITGLISTSGTAPIQFHWLRSNGTSTAIVAANPVNGVVNVTDTFTTGPGPLVANLWDRLVLVIPAATPTFTPSPTPNTTLTPQPTPFPIAPDIVYFQVVCSQ